MAEKKHNGILLYKIDSWDRIYTQTNAWNTYCPAITNKQKNFQRWIRDQTSYKTIKLQKKI